LRGLFFPIFSFYSSFPPPPAALATTTPTTPHLNFNKVRLATMPTSVHSPLLSRGAFFLFAAYPAPLMTTPNSTPTPRQEGFFLRPPPPLTMTAAHPSCRGLGIRQPTLATTTPTSPHSPLLSRGAFFFFSFLSLPCPCYDDAQFYAHPSC
jgi:hypothetical protein